MLKEKNLYKGKNLFFISNRDKFFKLQADSLVNKAGVRKDSIIAIVFEVDKKVEITKVEGIEYVDFNVSDLNFMIEAKSFTFMSLNNWNAPIAETLINKDKRVLQKLYIFITDDEVERWKINYEKNNCLTEDIGSHISKSCILVLQCVKNFIAPVPYFKELILKVLDRKDIEFINCSIIFEILPFNQSQLLRDSTGRDESYLKSNKKRVLVGTKSYKLIPFFKVFKDFNRYQKNSGEAVELLVFQSLSNRFLIDAFLLFRKLLRLKDSNVTYLSEMPPHLYSSLIGSCDYILLQDRGGASTARVFAKWGAGALLIKNGSPNYYFFKDVYKIDFISFDEKLKISERIRHEDLDLLCNSYRIIEEEKRSIEVYGKLYDEKR
ncbi:hypothetical protein [Idiomarina loihiensis]|uniref:Uncharacterized conserved membrane protein n=1 Tax=Idiomarina loihiensis (strain ATCC BAA-735 / DSM 15497 / L2-TR) TaxID=283942 RepID=Q5QUW4_IDILO|nr:hypothetical protein [Idiomarina loihiensis]AAV81387.1 Uncharacterized conserved membrane protein [Idiomarina loihiensis L2TR]AGM35414.1 hypothetical protein K734_02735 [Idiomarina loihiensis GSL 199]